MIKTGPHVVTIGAAFFVNCVSDILNKSCYAKCQYYCHEVTKSGRKTTLFINSITK